MHIRRKLAALVTAAGLICTLTMTAGIVLAANPAADPIKALASIRPSARRSPASHKAGVASQPLISIGTIAASFEFRSVSEVFTLRTFGAAVSFSTKDWNAPLTFSNSP